MISPDFLAVARGDAPAALLLTNARIINVFNGRIEPGNLAIHSGRIAGIGRDYTQAIRSIDLEGAYVSPGFIDAHMHVESTFLPPAEFARLAVPHGTTGVVLDPHEIANVLGVPGIRFVMENARGIPMHAMFALSSCVPATHLETSGASISHADLAPLFDDPRVVALAELMNFPGLVNGDEAVLAKVNLGLARRLVDGHAPGLTGRALQTYAAAGISSDHECTTAAEAIEKLALGLRIFIREGSAARNLEALLSAVTPDTVGRFCFCTDDRHPADLLSEGHIDHVVRSAIALGLDSIAAIRMASINPAQHYRQRDRGAVAPGFFADLLVFESLADIRPHMVFFEGRLAARGGAFDPGASLSTDSSSTSPSVQPLNLPDLSEQSFAIAAKPGCTSIRVIGMNPRQLVTEHLTERPAIRDGFHTSDPAPGRDILKLAVIERHRASGNIGFGFVKGFGLRAGALASTVGHDSHNLSIVGTNDRDMLVAARSLTPLGGGQCVVRDGRVLAVLPLPIAGLMSDQPAATVIARQRTLLDAAHSLGCPHHDPFMPLSFLSLPVIPHLKLTDHGLVDVDRFQIVPLEC